MTYMGVDQYGDTWHDLGQHPRKELLNRLNRKHASKMYVDKLNGPPVHIGWVIAGRWITVYKVERLEVQP